MAGDAFVAAYHWEPVAIEILHFPIIRQRVEGWGIGPAEDNGVVDLAYKRKHPFFAEETIEIIECRNVDVVDNQ